MKASITINYSSNEKNYFFTVGMLIYELANQFSKQLFKTLVQLSV
ncbi:hypothetical protein T190607A02C_170064 [Tenacibaculum sp. 190524A02b]